jgi:hypothetical protein
MGDMLGDFFELSALILVTALFSFLLIQNISMKIKIARQKTSILQEQSDKIVLYEKIEELMKNSSITGQNSDGFLKFVSQSRDWAFSYIEESQKAIENFQDVATKIIYDNKDNPDMKELILAYEELLKMLPESFDK